MIELIRNCSRDSESATYLIADHADKKIIKIASTAIGIKSLQRELQGWGWYCALRYPQRKNLFCQIIQKNVSYLKIGIEFIDGVKSDYGRGLIPNVNLLKKVMFHYCDIWPCYSDGCSVLHGDLSLDNIIYNKEGFHIIDWEYFNPNGPLWGFDAVYLLFETLYFGMKGRKQPSLRELDIVVDNITILNSHKQLSIDFIRSPLKTVKDLIVRNYKLWGDYLLTASRKLPVVSFTDSQVFLIDQAIFSRTKAML